MKTPTSKVRLFEREVQLVAQAQYEERKTRLHLLRWRLTAAGEPTGSWINVGKEKGNGGWPLTLDAKKPTDLKKSRG